MIILHPQTPFGKGAHRACFRHPEDAEKCIKISFPHNEKKDQLEQSYYAQLTKRKISWAKLSRSYGKVTTDRGIGYVFDLIQDYDGSISKPLNYYLSKEGAKEVQAEHLCSALARLRNYLLNEAIILANLKPYNFLYKKTGPQEGEFVVIDNVGYHNTHFHLCEHWDWFARLRIKKKWDRFIAALRRQYHEHHSFLQALDRIR